MAFLIVLQIFVHVGEFLLYVKFREEILDTVPFRRNIIEILYDKKNFKLVFILLAYGYPHVSSKL